MRPHGGWAAYAPQRSLRTISPMLAFDADYENGVLRPTKPLALKPGERVRLIVVSESSSGDADIVLSPEENRAALLRWAARPEQGPISDDDAGLP